ncbi:MAG: hypothetical protein LPK85_05720 [Gammaproteobacteria bacterium]|nr:hypothetical protein [Gammaproteobacteria bacterium]
MQPIPQQASEELQFLERRRNILERLILVARSIETLKKSLENLLNPGSDEEAQKPEILASLEALGRKVRNLSDADVQLRLSNLDERVKSKFRIIGPLIDTLSDEAANTDALEGAQEHIEEFKRQAQTALTLRVLMQRRGRPVSRLDLPLNRQSLLEKLKQLASREQQARKRVVSEVYSLTADIEQLLAKPDLLDTMRALLQQVLEGLKENLQHLLAGKSIQHLPLEMDSIDVGAPMRFNVPLPVVEEDVATDIVEAAPVIPHRHDTTAPESDTAVASASVTTPSTSDKATTGKPPSAAAEPALPVRRIGFWRAVKEWIFSPWEVTWKDVRNRPDDRDT